LFDFGHDDVDPVLEDYGIQHPPSVRLFYRLNQNKSLPMTAFQGVGYDTRRVIDLIYVLVTV